MNNDDCSICNKELTLKDLVAIFGKSLPAKIIIRGVYKEDKYHNKTDELFLPLNAAGIEICKGNIMIDIQELIYWHNKNEAEKERGEL